MASGKSRKRETIRKHDPDPPPDEVRPGILDSQKIVDIELKASRQQSEIDDLQAAQARFDVFMLVVRRRLGL